MKKFIFLALFLVAGFACEEPRRNDASVPAQQNDNLTEILAKNPIVVDVRTKEEFANGHYKNAINIPFDEIDKHVAELGDKEKNIVLYCHSGRRAGIAQNTLVQLGFKKVLNAGGLDNMPK